MKTIYRFLLAYSTVSDGKRTEFLIKMEDEPDFKSKVGEKLIFILNRIDDIDKAEVQGNLFKAWVEGSYTITVFYRLAGIVDKAFLHDMKAYGADKIREQDVLDANARGQYDFASFVKQYGPKREYNEFDLSNAGFLNTEIKSKDAPKGDGSEYYKSFIVYKLNIYGALILRYGFMIPTIMSENKYLKMPEI